MALNYGKVLEDEPKKEARPKTQQKTQAIPSGSLVIMPLASIKTQVKADEVGVALERSLAKVREIQVTDQESAAKIIDIAAGAKKAAKTIEAALKGIITEPESRIKECRGFAKLFIDKASDVELTAKGKVAAWQQQERIRREKEEREKREKAEALNKSLAEQAKDLGLEEVPRVEIPTAPTTPAVIRTEGGAKSSTAMVWTFEIKDSSKVPDEYKAVDERKIRDAIRVGVREISGVDIFQKEQIRIG